MAKTRFVFQGFTPSNHLAEAQAVLNVPDLDRAIISVAYMNKAGVRVLREALGPHKKKLSLFAGIRNPITTYQAMRSAFELGVDLTAVDTGSMHVAFHPKLYYARGEKEARLMVGSANLTPGGLNNNIEASLVTVLDLADEDDLDLCTQIEAGFDALHGEYPAHVLRMAKLADIEQLRKTGKLFDTAKGTKPPVNWGEVEEPEGDTTTPIVLKTQPLKVSIEPAKAAKKAEKAKPGVVPNPVELTYDLVWESKPLTERDLTIPTQANTNPTGSMNLDKGLLDPETDHRHYFHDEVFSSLEWTQKNATVVEATAPFEAVLKGTKIGTFMLAIRHTTSTDTASYKQKNAMTRLSWGTLAPHVRKPDLLERTARLYRAVQNPSAFMIEID